MWVSTNNARNLPGPVIVGGVTYSGTGGTRSWMFNDNNAKNYAALSSRWFLCQDNRCLLLHARGDDTFLRTSSTRSSCRATGGLRFFRRGTTMGKARIFAPIAVRRDGSRLSVPTQIKIVPGKTYWVNLHFGYGREDLRGGF